MKSNNFDVIRLILAVLVFFAHWNILTNQNFSNLFFRLETIAVDMFFVVSGFLIFWSFDADQNKKHFYIKRFFRIFPLYLFLIILQTLFFILYSDGTITQISKYFISNIFFLNFLSPSVGTTLSLLEVNAINGSLWTLKNEVVFYSIVPLLFLCYKRFGIFFLIFLYTLSISYMLIVQYIGINKFLVLFPSQLRLFIVGILLYIIFDKINKKNIYFMTFFSSVLMILFFENFYFKFILYPFFIGSIVMLLVYHVKRFKIDFDFSYSFYILHFPIIQLFLYFGINPINPILSFISLFCLILILSYFSEKYIEKKFIQIGRDIIKKYKLKIK